MGARLPVVLQCFAVLVAGAVSWPMSADGQALNWEGQAGLVFTPTAAVVPSSPGRVSVPAVGFHLLSGGEVIGTRFQIALTSGVARRAEIGFTRSAVSSAELSDLESLFDRGFSNIHGKVVLVEENRDGARPAVAVGTIVRFQRQHLAGALGVATKNADVYVVATKLIRSNRIASLLVSGGMKVTNASLVGIAGNAPGWSARAFGAVAVVVADLVTAGVEAVDQPRAIEGVAAAELPAIVSLFARGSLPGGRVSLEAGLTRLAGTIAPGVDVKAVNRLVVGASVRF